jgi:hypothetical protein
MTLSGCSAGVKGVKGVKDVKDVKDVKTTAYIIGNGPSRKDIDLSSLRESEARVWGCNALYRDFTPDYLVAVDKEMIKEIMDSGYHKMNKCYFKERSGVNHKPLYDHPNITTWNTQHSQPGNSGVSAIYHAIQHKYNRIILIGFDLRSTKGRAGIYADSANYLKHNHKPPNIRRSIPETIDRWITRNPMIEWIRVVDKNCWIPGNEIKAEITRKGLQGFKSIKHITKEELWTIM